MKITFQTPKNFSKLIQKETKIKKLTFVLLQNFYTNFKSDVINYLQYNKPLNYDNYKVELKTILKFTYSSFISLYDYDLLKNYNIQSTQKNNDIKNIINKIVNLTKESVNLQKNNFIDFLADKQSEIIFNNVQEKINALYSRSQKESYAELQNINDQLFDIGLELQKIETLQNTPQVEKTRKTLQEKQNYFLNKKTEYQNIVSIALLKFNKLYDTQIMQNRSVLQAENEVNLISNKIRSQEYNILNNIIQSQSNVEKVSQFKEWDSMLDLRTRKTHAEANGQIVNKNDLFVVYNPLNANPEYALEPMGEGLSIENTANCRCKARYSIDFILN